MRFEEILRAIADAVEKQGLGNQSDSKFQNIGNMNPVASVHNVDAAEQPDTVFIPPLQLKLELLKKAVDVDNIYDHTNEIDAEAAREEIPSKPIEEDEIVALKRAAGINPGIIQELVNDDPLDD